MTLKKLLTLLIIFTTALFKTQNQGNIFSNKSTDSGSVKDNVFNKPPSEDSVVYSDADGGGGGDGFGVTLPIDDHIPVLTTVAFLIIYYRYRKKTANDS